MLGSGHQIGLRLTTALELPNVIKAEIRDRNRSKQSNYVLKQSRRVTEMSTQHSVGAAVIMSGLCSEILRQRGKR